MRPQIIFLYGFPWCLLYELHKMNAQLRSPARPSIWIFHLQTSWTDSWMLLVACLHEHLPFFLSFFLILTSSTFFYRCSWPHTMTHSDTQHSVGLLWTRDQPVADTSTWQHSALTRDRHPCPRRDSNSQSQQASGRKPRPRDYRNRLHEHHRARLFLGYIF